MILKIFDPDVEMSQIVRVNYDLILLKIAVKNTQFQPEISSLTLTKFPSSRQKRAHKKLCWKASIIVLVNLIATPHVVKVSLDTHKVENFSGNINLFCN